MEAKIILTIKKNQKDRIKKHVFAKINPITREEFAAAGQRDVKPSFMAEVWGFEFEDHTGIIYEGKEYSIYRTYGPKQSGKIELYASERAGRQ